MLMGLSPLATVNNISLDVAQAYKLLSTIPLATRHEVKSSIRTDEDWRSEGVREMFCNSLFPISCMKFMQLSNRNSVFVAEIH